MWFPIPGGPQARAYDSLADDLFYGGAAGGAKTDLLCGTALTRHTRSIIFRRHYNELQAIVDRVDEMRGGRLGFNGQHMRWRLPEGAMLELGACKNIGDERSFLGRAHDLKGFDEITQFAEIQFRLLKAWCRTADSNQRCRVICTGNPPLTVEGRWVVDYWGPWLNRDHPNPAKDGELRWYAVIDGKDAAVDGPEPFMHGGELVTPQSRTFIRSRVQDNPYYMATGYDVTLQGLPGVLREAFYEGRFDIDLHDDPFQIIPSEWIDLAFERWRNAVGEPKVAMTALGVDVARGGKSQTVITPRHGNWFGPQVVYPGSDTPDGPRVAGLVLKEHHISAIINIDVIGVGASPYDCLRGMDNVRIRGLDSRGASKGRDKTGRLKFFNKRAEWHWKLREALDPDHGDDLMIHPDSELRADLITTRWEPRAKGIKVEAKEELMERLDRSPDKGESLVYANAEASALYGADAFAVYGQLESANPDWELNP